MSVTKEYRFAVVMYGGISLAVYINGVAQELLTLVRATSNDRTPPENAKLGEVYRQVAEILCERENPHWNLGDDLCVRFVVDIITGASAGGINGIFLAKALANDQPLGKLRDLWIEQADLDLLLNDKKSVADLNGQLKNQTPPQALLNGPRLYLELLKAFNAMGDDAAPTAHFQDLRELDLYVTATDAWGEVLPIRLFDKIVWERRYKSNFHFRYRDIGNEPKRNDLISRHNPFLAYAARCTSSFPFAFEPIKLGDLHDWLRTTGGVDSGDMQEWKELFFDRPENPGSQIAQWVEPEERVYVDGGCLDNKPFGYVTRTLQDRSPAVAVSRKLLYVEPSPDHPEKESQPRNPDGSIRKPDAIENALRALMVMPLDETIREDLEGIVERNRDIDRLNLLIHDVESDVLAANQNDNRTREIRRAQEKWDNCFRQLFDGSATMRWANQGFRGGDTVDVRYRGYSRLKVATITDELALMICEIAGFRRGSNEFYAVRCIVKAWREPRYRDEANKTRTLAHFLLRFDFSYRIRRLEFLLRRIDRLCFLKASPDTNDYQRERTAILQLLHSLWPVEANGAESNNPEDLWLSWPQLQAMRARVSRALEIIRMGVQDLRTPANKIPVNARDHGKWEGQRRVANAVRAIPITTAHLYGILGATDGDSQPVDVRFAFNEDQILKQAAQLLENPQIQTALDALDDALEQELHRLFDRALTEIREAFCVDTNTLTIAEARSCRLVRYYYDFFDDYDSILYPISYGTNLGEAAHVDVIRISPDDATSIIDESITGKAKLAGAKLGHFGAFLDASWRRNDILWGRLDAAERIVESLLIGVASQNQITALIARAQDAIIEEELGNEGLNNIRKLFVETVVQMGTTPIPNADAMTRVVQDLLENSPDRTRKVLAAALKPDELREAMKSYVVNPTPDPKKTLQSTGRAATIMGDIFQNLADTNGIPSHWTRWFAWAGTALWALVELSAPTKLMRPLVRHWFGLAALVSLALILMGPILGEGAAQSLGLKMLAITVILFVAVRLLSAYFRSKQLRVLAKKSEQEKQRNPFLEFMGWVAIGLVYFALVYFLATKVVRLF